MAELALDDVQRHSLAGELDGVRMAQRLLGVMLVARSSCLKPYDPLRKLAASDGTVPANPADCDPVYGAAARLGLDGHEWQCRHS